MSYNKVGEVQQAQGDLTAALQSYSDSRTIRERLAKADPGNAGWQRDLTVSHTKIADALKGMGKIPHCGDVQLADAVGRCRRIPAGPKVADNRDRDATTVVAISAH